jgi:Flp pilus assembly protein TadG
MVIAFMNKTIFKKLYTDCQSTRGNVAIEFAIVLPILLLLVIAVLDFGTVEFNKIYLRSAVNAGIASAFGVSPTPATVSLAVQNATPMKNLTISVTKSCKCANNTAISCTNTCTGGAVPDTYLQINASTSVSLTGVYAFLPNPYPLSEQAIMMVP